jgi:hypothetical protein
VTRPTAPSPAAPPGEPAGEPARLVEGLRGLREALAGARYPLALPSAEPAGTGTARLIGQLDDYLLPRLARLAAPLLAVVGGSTGAGKSTLVNSLIRAPVSQAGVLRPTTLAPVLVSHPTDTAWFAEAHLLPGLPRTTGLTAGAGSLQLVAAPGLPPGLALLDAPDIDTVVDANRTLADRLLTAADLWLFVTTAARYADAVPWEVLRVARDRGTVLALVLDRVPPGGEAVISAHLGRLLEQHGLAGTRLFAVPETGLDGQGLLAEPLVQPLRAWLDGLAGDTDAQQAVIRQTLSGALAALAPTVAGLATAAEDQVAAAAALGEGVSAARAAALSTVEEAARDGTLLRGAVLECWQEFVDTGQFAQVLHAHAGRRRDLVGAAVTGRQAPGAELRGALSAGLRTVIEAAAADAEDRVRAVWGAQPGLLATVPPGDDPAAAAARLVRRWQRWVLDLVRREAAGRYRMARVATYPVSATSLLVILAMFAASVSPIGAGAAVADGTAAAGQPLLAAVFRDEALRNLAGQARADLHRRVRELLYTRMGRFTAALSAAGVPADAPGQLRAAAAAVNAATADATTAGTLTAGAATALAAGGSG